MQVRISFFLLSFFCLSQFYSFSQPETTAQHNARMQWWRDARFGMFIHWGLYAVPAGEWNIDLFVAAAAPNTGINDRAVDYLDPEAIQHYFSINHDVFAKQFSKYFGNTIKQTFFDDVGFYTGAKNGERTWTNRFNEKFMQLNGKDPAMLYPALWEDIGTNTQSARVAFFNTRAELLAEGYPKMASRWDEKHGLIASGHHSPHCFASPMSVQSTRSPF